MSGEWDFGLRVCLSLVCPVWIENGCVSCLRVLSLPI